jgi:hypothetical protein
MNYLIFVIARLIFAGKFEVSRYFDRHSKIPIETTKLPGRNSLNLQYSQVSEKYY